MHKGRVIFLDGPPTIALVGGTIRMAGKSGSKPWQVAMSRADFLAATDQALALLTGPAATLARLHKKRKPNG